VADSTTQVTPPPERPLDASRERGVRETWPEESEPPSRSDKARSYFRRHPAAKWVVLGIVLLVVVAGVLVWRYYASRETTDDAQIDGHIVPVSARVGGTVIGVNVDDNQVVRAGDVLVQLDPTDYRVLVERAQADLLDAQANARAARTSVPVTHISTSSDVRTAEAALAAAQQQVSAAQAQEREAAARYNLAAQDVKRFQQLVVKNEISQQRYDTAVAAEQQAAAAVDAARAAVADAQSHVAEARARLAGARSAPQQVSIMRSRAGAADAQAQRAKAALDQAKLNLQYTTVRAAYNGIVSKKTVEPGQVVQPGQPLMALINLDDLWVIANYKETQLHSMRPGQPARIHVDAFDRDFDGHVDSIAGASGARFSLLPPENATGNYVKVVQRIPVKIVFEKGQDPSHLLRPGMSVEPTVSIK
jgi:membrane fusion protein (multidrug efflux system)